MPLALFPAVVIALMAVLILLGSQNLAKWIGSVIPSNLPLIGSWLHNTVVSLAESTVAGITAVLDVTVSPLLSVIEAPLNAVRTLFDDAYNTVHDLYQTVAHVTKITVPWVIATAQAYTLAKVAAATSTLGRLIDAARAYALALATKAEQYAADAVHAAKTDLLSVIDTYVAKLGVAIDGVRLWAGAEITAARAYAAGLVTTAVSDLTGLLEQLRASTAAAITAVTGLLHTEIAATIRTAETLAADAQAAAIKAVDVEVPHALAGVWTDVLDGVDGAVTAGAGAFDDVLGDLAKLARAVPADVAAATAVTGALAVTVTRYLERCGIPNCRNLSGFGSELQAILGLVGDAAFFALIIELIEHPSDGARTVETLFTGAIDDTLATWRQLVGAA